MQRFESDYADMIYKILRQGEHRETRNGLTTSLFGESLEIHCLDRFFPLVQGRKMYPAGVIGEFAAMIRGPKSVEDFTKWGCNYWHKWADADGALRIDYGNAWTDFNGVNQIEQLKHMLRYDKHNRRMIISSWRPDRLDVLSLPCCHYSYQFYVSADNKLSMIWTQRSVDMMIGLPSDIILAALWVITLANEFNLVPGKIKMDFGDCHIYQEHDAGAMQYVKRVLAYEHMTPVTYNYTALAGEKFEDFEPRMLKLSEYTHYDPITLELKA